MTFRDRGHPGVRFNDWCGLRCIQLSVNAWSAEPAHVCGFGMLGAAAIFVRLNLELHLSWRGALIYTDSKTGVRTPAGHYNTGKVTDD